MREVRKAHPDRGENSLSPTIQGMTVNATGGPPSASGRIFFRVDRGVYELYDPARHGDSESPQPPPPNRRRGKVAELDRRVDEVTTHFERYVEIYDEKVPFTRKGQWQLHKQTVEQRRQFGSVAAAIQDENFLHLLRETLKKWGADKRASRLTEPEVFAEGLRAFSSDLSSLENLSIEDPDLPVKETAQRLWELVSNLPIVTTKSKIVYGSKVLHHLFPELMPPIDRAWTKQFFMWSNLDQNPQRIFTDAFETFAKIGRETRPSRLIGAGWRTCTSKIIDNALIGYLKDQFDDISRVRAFKSPTVGIAVVIRRDNRVLMLRQRSLHEGGTWSVPSGYLDFGETPEAGALKEAEEGTGLTLEELKYIGFTNDIFEEIGLHHVTLWYETKTDETELVLSDESDEWGWFELDDLPNPLFLPFKNLLDQRFLA